MKQGSLQTAGLMLHAVRAVDWVVSTSPNHLAGGSRSYTHAWAFCQTAIANLYAGELDIVDHSVSSSGKRAGPTINPLSP